MSPLQSFLPRRSAFRYLPIPIYVFAAGIFIQDNLFEISTITGSSMAPTLSPLHETTGQRDGVLWKKWNATHDLQRGDIVLFNSPRHPELMSVKRVIGLQGDEVWLDKKRRPADFENGRFNEAGRRWDLMRLKDGGKVKVPQGHVWLEGDNWRRTMDSNDYGPVSNSMIRGKAVALVWPWRQFGRSVGGAEDGFVSRTRVVPGKVREMVEEKGGWWEVH